MATLERIISPYVTQRTFVATQKELRQAVAEGVVKRPLATSIRQALLNRRRFLLVPGLKDWVD